MSEVLAQITAPHFVAAAVLVDGVVTEAAPIVRYMVGWRGREVRAYCARKGWDLRRVNGPDQSH